jgi:hypothetical protein
MTAGTINTATLQVTGPGGVPVAGTVTYDSSTKRATFAPAVPLPGAATFTAIVKGGSGGVRDSFGIQLASDVTWTFSTAADTTAPVISAVAVSAISGAAVITWKTNEPATSRVDFGIVATALTANAIDATLATTHTLVVSGLVPATVYYFRVTSADAFANSATSPLPGSAPATFVMSNPAGLVAAFNFDEGGGATANDASGMANNGAISGAAWTTAGRFGGALSFDGASNWITVPDSPTLKLASEMTLEAWIRPAALTGWRPILYKESPFSATVPATGTGMSYALYASDLNAPPSVYAMTSAGSDQWIHALGTAMLPLDTWTHVAGTYDGSALRLYLNGVLVKTTPHTGPIFDTTGPLRIGGSAIVVPGGAQFFKGFIDEVRVYSRALSPLEIQADMTTPLP